MSECILSSCYGSELKCYCRSNQSTFLFVTYFSGGLCNSMERTLCLDKWVEVVYLLGHMLHNFRGIACFLWVSISLAVKANLQRVTQPPMVLWGPEGSNGIIVNKTLAVPAALNHGCISMDVDALFSLHQGEVNGRTGLLVSVNVHRYPALFANGSINPSLNIYWKPTMYEAQESCEKIPSIKVHAVGQLANVFQLDLRLTS